jgi:5,10-methylene-tetrahydrofolate dehydrogenase/methenyl tetrahydrofolate cyclohydrolase
MKLILIIGSGSFIGGISRYLLSLLIQAKSTSSFPHSQTKQLCYLRMDTSVMRCFIFLPA